MNSKLFKAMRQKKKREVDPNAPPRPNLMTHDLKLRNQKQDIELMSRIISDQSERLRRLENKLNNQTVYLQALHSKLKQ